MDDARDQLIKKLLYSSQHRGMKEADVLIGGFAKNHLAAMTLPELEAWQELLDENDNDLIDWLLERKPLPFGIHGGMLERLYQYVQGRLLV